MTLRAAIVFLLVLNLGVAAWWLAGGNAVPPDAPDTSADVAPRLRLAAEAAPAASAASAPPIASTAPPADPTPAPTQVATPGPSSVAPLPAPSPEAAQCLRFGPFASTTARDAARPRLAAASTVLVPREAPARPARGWKVSIPPFGERDEAVAMAERLRAAGVSDLYVMNDGVDANSVALGRYGSEEAARRREADLRAKGFPAQATPLGNPAPQWWLDAELARGIDPGPLVRLAPARMIDCASLR